MATARRSKSGTLLVAVGLLALLGTVSMLLASQVFPERVLETLVETTESIDAERAATAIAIVLTLCALVYVRGDSSTADDSDLEPLVETDPEEAARPVTVVGAAFDMHLAESLEAVERGDRSVSQTGLETTLEDAVIQALQLHRDCSRERALSLLESGEWTDDGVAAGFLADDLDFPLRFRVLEWLRPELAAERAIERSVAELSAILEREEVSSVGTSAGAGVEPADDEIESGTTATRGGNR
ncbi:DUF7269 family protein [Natronoglomus mannanivorans]|uniref:Uncharacterized protein n=1 Tax=Natronoglomus mannanivorans TaxID=2979990 RepID=A0AAP2YX38_9EURY|nr:hypothetical protein [Halobacteria archaeon AArc-xg1-1]